MSDITERDLMILAATLYGEADPGNRDDAEKIAAVICNRAWAPGWWGTDLPSVCLADKQFTCWNWLKGIGAEADRRARERLLPLLVEGDPLRPRPEAFRSGWAADCLEIATLVVAAAAEGGEDPAEGATHYFATYITPPTWAKGGELVARSRFRSGRHGHDFYRIGSGDGATARPPRVTPIPRGKPVEGAAATLGTGILGTLTDLLATGGETIRAVASAVAGLLRDGPGQGVPVGAFLFLGALLLFALGWMLWIRWSEVRTWNRRWPWEDAEPEGGAVAPPSAPEASAVDLRLLEALERIEARLDRSPPAPRRAARPRKPT